MTVQLTTEQVEQAQAEQAQAEQAQAEQTEQAVPFTRTEICPEARVAALRVLASGRVATGAQAAMFEREFAARVKARHAVAVSSGTAAIELALRAMRLPPGGIVLVPAVTFCGVAQAVLHAGLRPLLVDVDPVTAMPSPATVAAALQGHAHGRIRPAAMLMLHFGGAPAPLPELAAAAGLPLYRVIEDAAHGPGTTIHGRAVGALSRAACFSFSSASNLPIGEGGMVTCDDGELAARVRRAGRNGMSADVRQRDGTPGSAWHFTVEDGGLKANMPDLEAAIGRAQLRRLPGWQRLREQLAAAYTLRLHDVGTLLPPSIPTGGRHAWNLYVLQVTERYGRSRDELAAALAERGIGTAVHYVPLHRLGYFRHAALRPISGLPGADQLFPRLLSLPLYPGLSENRVERICTELHRLAR
ncbi:dTDP-4-amino-4,6-dideoxygalactose transaminase [Kitasatospora sp. GP30]|uniref:DegT/DnrJ/EryC1/StrS family aminotransferase n=1 Tax=Kitasatospora sp. GP30 TaxID=3035084 RepID=UPI000C7155AF|nr:DegT/DnrJ/EryC1/StrS family aminotransferase [Kitasatospora sp. GP30]MDH6142382.1 dTDP-4-amino-4,6-dideoxygalactose transaminase [Kitasatospora sp. GP30]